MHVADSRHWGRLAVVLADSRPPSLNIYTDRHTDMQTDTGAVEKSEQ